MSGNGTNGITAETVNERIDNMVPAFNGLKEQLEDGTARVTKLERAYMTHIQANMQEYTEQIAKIDGITKDITATPALKFENSVVMAELCDQIAAAAEQLDDIEAELYLNVTAELDDDNKLVYTNETSRKAAMRLAMRHSDEYQEIKGQLDKLNMEKARLQAQLRQIEDADKTWKMVYRGCVARVENITARISL